MYVRERDAAIETYERSRRGVEEKARAARGEGGRDEDDDARDDDGEALASVMRAREIAERLFAPMEREPGTIVIDFEGGARRRRETRRRRRSRGRKTSSWMMILRRS